MCGLFAVVPTRELTDEEVALYTNVFYMLGILNESRGNQSFGCWAKPLDINHGVPAHWALGSIKTDENKAGFRKFIAENTQTLKRGGWFAGHTRYASHGAINLQNCHPFCSHLQDESNLFLAHNGVITVETDSSHPVDTGQLVDECSRGRGLAGVKEAINKASGSMGLIFSIDDILYFYSSRQNLAYMRTNCAYLVSSKQDVLELVSHLLYIDHKVVAEFKEELIYTFNKDIQLGWQTRPAPAGKLYNKPIRRWLPKASSFVSDSLGDVGWTADQLRSVRLAKAEHPLLLMVDEEDEEEPEAMSPEDNMICDFCMEEAQNLVVREEYQICGRCQQELGM